MTVMPFNQSACPKCLGWDATYRYCKTSFCLTEGYGESCDSQGLEHLHRVCTQCGYEWLERTAEQEGLLTFVSPDA